MRVLVALFLTALMMPLHAADWVLDGNYNGIIVHTREVPGQDLKEFRGKVRLKAPMRNVVAALVDADHMPEWCFNLREARVLEIGGPDGSFIYLWMKGIWPVSDRDAVGKIHLHQDPKSLVFTMSATAAPERYPLMLNRVRIPRMKSSWTVTPVSANVTDIQLEGNADPGGRIPLWIANFVATMMPKETLKKMRIRLETPGVVNPAVLTTDPRVVKLLGNIRFPESTP